MARGGEDSGHADVLIVGAGISGIGAAYRLSRQCAGKSLLILKARDRVGGTWDLFRYPGVRSDSDIFTLGFPFRPWPSDKSIVEGAEIRDYVEDTARELGLLDRIRFRHRVTAAAWSSEHERWTVEAEHDGQALRFPCSFLSAASGYYDYDAGHRPRWPGEEEFGGRIVHPQAWPEALDAAGKSVAVIGSGATAVTLVPAMAKQAARVTMLQRTPTWMFSRPAKDAVANVLRRWLPEELAYRITRWKNIRLQNFGFKRARQKPEKVKAFLHRRIRKSLGEDHDLAPFTPPYNPWDQRLCLVPDDDLFAAIKAGTAEVVTARIAGFEADGVRLEDGALIPADIVVTATGLKLAVAGKIAISLDGEAVDFAARFHYKGCMFSNLPNLAAVFGYLNASWTLRADINADYICRVLNAMKASGSEIAVPALPEDHALEEDDIFDFSSGYIQRSKHIMPRNALAYPWRLDQDYLVDVKRMATDPIEDGILEFRRAGEARAEHTMLEAAE